MPAITTAIPRWARLIPIKAGGSLRSRLTGFLELRRRRKILNPVLAATHSAKATPAASVTPRPPRNIQASQARRAMISAGSMRRAIDLNPSPFQRMMGPMPMIRAMGIIKGTKTLLKYGGPTEILPTCSASIRSGYRVPSKTVAEATTSRTLFTSSKVSLDSRSN